ncbi:MAG: preprotein translocase subunit SecA [Alphaproteobacteria bacterium]
MFGKFAKSVFGTANERYIKKLQKHIHAIEKLEPEYAALSDNEIKAKTEEFKERLRNGASLDDILVEAFANVREAAKRTLNLRAYPVQLIGGIVLHRGQIAEMRTGEGKTLVSTFAVYLNALEGKGVHVVTVNDYLASRDAEWMGAVYKFLGLTVGCIVHGLNDDERRAAYNCDITYATNNELGFDYLRDNMKYSRADMVQRPFNYAIVDEVDSILVDEARTPLIISGPSEDHSDLYKTMNEIIKTLKPEDYEIDQKSRSIQFTEEGNEVLETKLRQAGIMTEGSLYDTSNITLIHHSTQAAMANFVFVRDVDYMVKPGNSGSLEVMIIDPFTGRTMEGRRWSNGLHQAVEAKEGVDIQSENQTLASITYQNYFRLYPKLAGMTGTAMTEAGEFMEIYKLEVIDIPTNVPITRKDHDDLIYLTEKDKLDAVIAQIKECIGNNQPVLVGTASVEKSEELSNILKKLNIKHNVLNARQHEREAEVIALAGEPGNVTIATNMAGRGTDIQLGGNLDKLIKDNPNDEPQNIKILVQNNREKVLAGGGLAVIGTERHESRRIDNQLRGRSGRQGDVGLSRFYLSLEDDLMRRFGSDRLDGMLRKFGLKEGESIEHPWVTKALERAQKNVENYNFDARKQSLKYDDVLNDQRREIYGQRIDIMDADDLQETILDVFEETAERVITRSIPAKAYADQWDIETLTQDMSRIFGIDDVRVDAWIKEEAVDENMLIERVLEQMNKRYLEQKELYGEAFNDIEKNLMLQIIDRQWQEHLLTLDHLRQGIGLRAYGQRNPLDEYKREAFELFQILLEKIREQTCSVLSHLVIQARNTAEDDAQSMPPQQAPEGNIADTNEPELEYPEGFDPNDPETWASFVSRNSPCPCGSGKKFKQCHGKLN